MTPRKITRRLLSFLEKGCVCSSCQKIARIFNPYRKSADNIYPDAAKAVYFFAVPMHLGASSYLFKI